MTTPTHWHAHKPPERSVMDRVLTSPITFAVALGLLCAMPVLALFIR